MQHYRHTSPALRSSRSLLLALLIVPSLFAICVSSISVPKRIYTPGIIESRQQTFNKTDFFIGECGVNFVECKIDPQQCCRAGFECSKGDTTGRVQCLPLPGSPYSPSPTPSTSSAPPPSSSNKNSNIVGPVVGGVLGFVILVGIGATVFLLYRRRHPPSTPAIPDAPAPFPHMPNMIEAKYPPPSENGYSGDTWHPGSYLYNNRNRSMSVDSNGRSMSPYDNISPGGYIPYQTMSRSNKMEEEMPHIVELPDSELSPSVELPADGYFGAKNQAQEPRKELEQSSGNPSMTSLALAKPAKVFTQFWRRSK